MRDAIAMLGEAVRSPREVKTPQGILVIFLHLLCKTVCCLSQGLQTPQNNTKFTAVAVYQHDLADPTDGETLCRGLKAPEDTSVTFFHHFSGGRSTVSCDGNLQGITPVCAV